MSHEQEDAVSAQWRLLKTADGREAVGHDDGQIVRVVAIETECGEASPASVRHSVDDATHGSSVTAAVRHVRAVARADAAAAGLLQVVAAAGMDVTDSDLDHWLEAPHPDLKSKSPLEVLRIGQTDRVLALLRHRPVRPFDG